MKKNGRHGMFYIALFVICFIGGRMVAAKQTAQTGNFSHGARIAIVIDDFGYGGEGTMEMLALPIPFTAAVMPFCEGTQEDLERVREAGKEIFLHMPMEALTGERSWIGEGGIFCEMADDEIRCAVEHALHAVPDAVGMNNHMGSAVMENTEILQSVMKVAAENDLIFLDSKTTANSCGEVLAKEYGVVYLSRDVFLDGTNHVEAVKGNLRRTAETALTKGSAIAIGHVGPEGGLVTARALAEMIPELEAMGITFVTAGEIGI